MEPIEEEEEPPQTTREETPQTVPSGASELSPPTPEPPHPQAEPAQPSPPPETPAAPAPATPPSAPDQPYAEPPDYLAQRQRQLEEMWREERLQTAQEMPRVRVEKKREPAPHPEKGFLAQIRPPEEGSEPPTHEVSKEVLKEFARENLTKIEGFYRHQMGSDVPPGPPPSALNRWKGKLPRSRRFFAALAILLLVTGAVFSCVMVVRADLRTIQQETTALAQDLQSGRFTSARERVQLLTQKEQRYRGLYQTFRPVVSVTQGKEKTTHLDQVFALSQKGTRLATEGLTLYNDVELAYRQFVGSEEGNTLDTVERLSGEFEGMYTELSTFQAEIQQLQNPYDLQMITDLKTKFGEELPQLRRYTLSAQKISQVMPHILAEGGEKNYLVLLQNNAELRPTGGFIGSFALVRIRDGKLLEFTVEDVYEADGQLQGYVTPPEEIVQYLGEAQWFLRDVNWSPDFPKVAERAAWFLDKTLNTKVDGVIATNLTMIEKLMAVTGPLELVDYGEVITQDNLYERAEAHSELNFFPGSTQKKDFLSAVAQQLLDKIFYQQTNKVAMARAVLDSAEEAELLMSVTDPQAEEVLATLGWTGALLTPNCPPPFNGENCVVDTVMQVEANVGVNKANQHLSRAITHEVELMNDVARHIRRIAFTNTAQSEAWPAGKYKTYLRLFVPKGSQLRGASLDGQPLDLTSFKQVEEDGKQVFGYFLEVPIKDSRTLEVFYETPLPAGYKTYALFEQKQSGVWNNEVQHTIDVGLRNVVTVAPEPSKIEGRSLEFVTDHTKHEFFAVELE